MTHPAYQRLVFAYPHVGRSARTYRAAVRFSFLPDSSARCLRWAFRPFSTHPLRARFRTRSIGGLHHA